MDLTISIVSYNTRDLLIRALASIFKYTKNIKFEVIVVDNNSTDESASQVAKQFPKVKLITNKENNFYTGANNQVLKIARGRYFLILNSDMYIKDNAFAKLVEYLDKHKDVGGVEPLQLSESGEVIKTGAKHATIFSDLLELTLLHKFFGKNNYIKKIRLENQSRKKSFDADVICDGAMMVRTNLFKKIGGYDEKLKLYYTENDLCISLQNLGYKITHFANAAFYHTISASTNQLGWISVSNHYANDGKYYYQKHHGLMQSLIYFSALKLNNWLIQIKKNLPSLLPLFLILFIAAFLRFYRLPELMPLIGDQGRDLIAARDFVQTKQIPLLGIESSVPRFRQGPIYVWFLAAVMSIAGYSPVVLASAAAFLGLIAVGGTYWLAEKYFDKKTAVLSSLFLAASPLAVAQSRMVFHTNAIPLSSLIFLWSIYSIKSRKNIFVPILAFTLLFQLELVVAPLFLLIPLSFMIFKYMPTKKDFVYGSLGLIIGLLPQIIYDISHNFAQLGVFLVWIGYRLVSFFGLYPEHTASPGKFLSTSISIFVYLQKYISWGSSTITFLILTIIALFTFTTYKTHTKEIKVIVSWLGLMIISFLILGNASEAYFPVLFIPLALLFGHVFSNISTNKTTSIIVTVLIFCLVFFNGIYTIKHNFFTSPRLDGNKFGTYGPPLHEQLEIVNFINLRVGDEINLKSVGSGSEFPSVLDNYYYLLWYYYGISKNEFGDKVWIYPKAENISIKDSVNYQFSSTTVSLPLNSY